MGWALDFIFCASSNNIFFAGWDGCIHSIKIKPAETPSRHATSPPWTVRCRLAPSAESRTFMWERESGTSAAPEVQPIGSTWCQLDFNIIQYYRFVVVFRTTTERKC